MCMDSAWASLRPFKAPCTQLCTLKTCSFISEFALPSTNFLFQRNLVSFTLQTGCFLKPASQHGRNISQNSDFDGMPSTIFLPNDFAISTTMFFFSGFLASCALLKRKVILRSLRCSFHKSWCFSFQLF